MGKIKLTCFLATFWAMELSLVPGPGGYYYCYHGN